MHHKFKITLLFLILFSAVVIKAQQKNDTSGSSHATGRFLIEDSPVVKTLDSLAFIKIYGKRYFTLDSTRFQKAGSKPDAAPTVPDSVIKKRLAILNAQTPIELTYNKEVKSFINLYANKRRLLTEKVLGLSEIYFPMIEEILDRYDMPLELKYLAVVESALNPRAGSNKGAKGLWQFMYGTGKVYGLKVTSMVDDRYDPYKSTVAACEHLQDLYDIYGDWSLAMAAYNSGAGNVNRALRRSGGVKNYWAVWPFLPRETRGYVPAFIAVAYIMNYPAEHHLYPMRPNMFFYDIDTVHVSDVLAFDQLHEMLHIPMEQIKFLNPQYKKNIIPAVNGKQYILRLPRRYTADFINNEDSLYMYKTVRGIEHDKLMAAVKKAGNRNIHIVRSGESLGLIAKKYHVYVSQIKRWNHLRNNTIYPGQKLVLFGYAGKQGKSYAHKAPVKRSKNKSYYYVKNGENLGLIAKKYHCSVIDLKEWNGLHSNTIHPGQRLYVYKPVSKSKTTLKKGKYMYHVVQKGDTLWDIAKEYDGVTVEQIKRLNRITNTHRLKPGQKIKIAVIS